MSRRSLSLAALLVVLSLSLPAFGDEPRGARDRDQGSILQRVVSKILKLVPLDHLPIGPRP